MSRKKLLTKMLTCVVSCTSIFCACSTIVHAKENASLPEIHDIEMTFERDSETGHISLIESESDIVNDVYDAGEPQPNAYVPSSYGSLGTLTQTYPGTRNQNPYGLCWSFAATACAEFDLIKNHGYNRNIDLSELQLAYFNYHTGSTLTGLDDDYIYIPSTSTSKSYLTLGGHAIYSMHTLGQWKTYTSEATLPLEPVKNNASYPVTTTLNTRHDGAQLRNTRYLDIKNNPASVKQAIMNYGAVYVSYNHNSNYYNYTDTALYYNPNTVGTNHDVVIIGWDDNFSRTKWPSYNRPSRNGAWLVRNSWSANQNTASEYSYFWMSYDEKSLASIAYSLDFEPGNQSDTLYQHDGSTTHATVNTSGMANIFTTSASATYAERLDSVMVSFTNAANVNYKVEIYTGVNSSNPISGRLNSSATTTGWTSERGIYTIDLKSPVYLYPGERFSIVVTALNGPVYFDLEKSQDVTYKQDGVTRTWFSTIASIDSGESFILDNSGWFDARQYGSPYGNACIKAVTSQSTVMKYRVNYELSGGTNHTSNPDTFTTLQSNIIPLQTPKRTGYHFCGWYTDPSYARSISYIDPQTNGNLTLYAKWCSDSNPMYIYVGRPASTTQNGTYSIKCNACHLSSSQLISYQIENIRLNKTNVTYTGSNKSPEPIITTINGETLIPGTDYTYTYSKNTRKNVGRYSVTIQFQGRYTGEPVKKYFTITPEKPSSASAVLYGYDDIKVSWNKSTGASGYYVYYKRASASEYSLLKRTTNRTVNAPNLKDNVKYNFKIVPYYKSSNGTRYKSTDSRIVSATTLKKLNKPAMKKIGKRVSLTWDTASAASGYQIYWSSSKNGKYRKLCEYSNNYSGATFTVGRNVTYWYKTRAYRVVNGSRIYGPYSIPKSYKYK